MSLTIKAPTSAQATSPWVNTRAARPALFWAQLGLVVALIAGSGLVRWVQWSKVSSTLAAGRNSPFPLKNIPLELGPWKGFEDKIDSEIARATGSTDRIFRTYTDRRTGVKLSVIVLYGPASDVYIHSPEICYPASGYAKIDGPNSLTIPSGRKAIPFRELVYAKGNAAFEERQHVYFTWSRGANEWSPAMPSPKQVERIPGMFKVHVARQMNEKEQLEGLDPCQDFLEVLMPDLERRVSNAEAARAKPTAPVAASTQSLKAAG
jgi:hypothetical protein